jgi:hypothetical protein
VGLGPVACAARAREWSEREPPQQKELFCERHPNPREKTTITPITYVSSRNRRGVKSLNFWAILGISFS